MLFKTKKAYNKYMENTCEYIFIRGKRKNKQCTAIIVCNRFCRKHCTSFYRKWLKNPTINPFTNGPITPTTLNEMKQLNM